MFSVNSLSFKPTHRSIVYTSVVLHAGSFADFVSFFLKDITLWQVTEEHI